MNFGGFSWKRFLGISQAKARLSRKIGIPLTRSTRDCKKFSTYIAIVVFIGFSNLIVIEKIRME
jgi:hypothetical protein